MKCFPLRPHINSPILHFIWACSIAGQMQLVRANAIRKLERLSLLCVFLLHSNPAHLGNIGTCRSSCCASQRGAGGGDAALCLALLLTGIRSVFSTAGIGPSQTAQGILYRISFNSVDNRLTASPIHQDVFLQIKASRSPLTKLKILERNIPAIVS